MATPTIPAPPVPMDLMVHVQPPPQSVVDAVSGLKAACEAWPMTKAPSLPTAPGMVGAPMPDAPAMMCMDPEAAQRTGVWVGLILAIAVYGALLMCYKAVNASADGRVEKTFAYVYACVSGAALFCAAALVAIVIEHPFPDPRIGVAALAASVALRRWWVQRRTARIALS